MVFKVFNDQVAFIERAFPSKRIKAFFLGIHFFTKFYFVQHLYEFKELAEAT